MIIEHCSVIILQHLLPALQYLSNHHIFTLIILFLRYTWIIIATLIILTLTRATSMLLLNLSNQDVSYPFASSFSNVTSPKNQFLLFPVSNTFIGPIFNFLASVRYNIFKYILKCCSFSKYDLSIPYSYVFPSLYTFFCNLLI